MHWRKCLCFPRQPFIVKASLANQKVHLENQKAYSVNCTGKVVFGFQHNLCSPSLPKNQIELSRRRRFWDPNKNVQFLFTDLSNVDLHQAQLFHVLCFSPQCLQITKKNVLRCSGS